MFKLDAVGWTPDPLAEFVGLVLGKMKLRQFMQIDT